MRLLLCCVLFAMVADIATAEDAGPFELACPNKLSLKRVQDVDMPGAMPGLGVVEIDKAHPIGLHTGDILIRINGKRIRNLEEYRDIEPTLDPQEPAQVTVNRFDEKMRKRKTMTLDLTPVDLERLEREADEKERRGQEIAAETEQRLAVMRQRVFTLPDGGQVTGVRVEEFNKGIMADVLQFLPKLQDHQLRSFNRATDAVKRLAQIARVGDDARLLANVKEIYAQDGLARDITWYLEQTPAGSLVLPCDDGQALE